MKRQLAIALLTLSLLPLKAPWGAGFTGEARAQEPQLLRVANQLPSTAAVTRGLNLWKSKVEAATGGKVKVELYSDGALYKDNEVFAAVQSHSIDMGLVVSAQFTAYDPIFAIFDMPGLFTGYDQVSEAIRGKVGAILTEHLHKLGVHPLYWPQQGFSSVATTKRPLNTPADFKRLKLRGHSKELARMFQLLGASPVVIAPSEVTTAISRGTIDGLSTSLSSYFSRKWYESAPHINNTRFGVIGTVVIINKELWDGLSPDVRNAVESASKEAETFSTKTVIDEEAGLLDTLRAKGVETTVFDAAATQQLLKLTRPMYDEYVASAGAEGRALLDYVATLKK